MQKLDLNNFFIQNKQEEEGFKVLQENDNEESWKLVPTRAMPHYETLKHNGDFPIIGVNTYLNSKGSPTILPKEVIRATENEKKIQIKTLEGLNSCYESESQNQLKQVQQTALNNENLFEALMEACKVCSLGQITNALFEVGGQYRRNM